MSARGARNRRLLAERLGWPAGALEACEDVERRFPGWAVFWCRPSACPGFERPAGFWAVHDGVRRLEVFTPDAGELAEALEFTPLPERPRFRWIESVKRR